MESASFIGVFPPSSVTKCLTLSPPSKLSWISERNRHHARNRFSVGYRLHIRSEKSHGGLDIDRRRLLLSSSAMGLSVLTAGKSLADPFPAPDLSKWVYPTDLPDGAQVTGGCCPTYTSNTKIVDFEFPTKLPMRTRMAAHLVDDAYVNKYSKAIEEMKKLPEDDPRSFLQQANVHCAYCNGAYLVGPDSKDYQVHKSWFFAPFHRWYIYFYERILAKLIKDDSFALPFWNWDSEVGMSIPPMFTTKELSIYDENRDACHQPPIIINLDEPTSCDNGSVKSNYSAIYTHMVSGATTPKLFHGGDYRYASDEDNSSTGTLEASPHNLVHPWTGSSTNTNRENLGSLYSAGRDPLFYCHHANVDRMWYIWNSKLGRTNYQDSDLLNSKFLFYDENKNLVRVKAGDCYDIGKLRYQFQELDLPWLNTGRSVKKAGPLKPKPSVKKLPESPNQLTVLKGPVTFRVTRPTKTRSTKEKEEAEEILIVGGIEVDMAETSKFSIFLNFPEATGETGVDSPHYAGTFVHLGHGKHEMKTGTTKKTSTNKLLSYKVGITETLEDIDASEDDIISVTLVPQKTKFLPKSPIKFTSIKIAYDTK